MSKDIPGYFETIKQEAGQRWEQLERYPDLAAPWHQLFRQIQSPRHVVSELLQNADDVGATWASVTIRNGYFIFRHNGFDFDEDNLRSLCRFGYSNKRALHTIGFRGIGFKSTFSLGPLVEVFSPTLALYFHKNRFTEPIWRECDFETEDGVTSIRVKIENPEVVDFLSSNLQQWIEIPLPLLFFKNIKLLSFNGQKISREVFSEGPVSNSKRLSLLSKEESLLLLISSREENIPNDALMEIREERGDTEFDVPPCRVDIIWGLDKQQLYEILPTNVAIQLPFSANAPFIQDPARTGIKDPLRSPMNRWLLQRIGELAFSAFTEWLSNANLSSEERAEAYALLPKKLDDYGNSISGYCEKTITDIFRKQIQNIPVLLTTQSSLASTNDCLNIDPDLLDVWSDQQLIGYFGNKQSSIIAREVGPATRRLLGQWGLLEQRTHSTNFDRLTQNPPPPKPTGLDRIKILWTYVNTHLANWSGRYWHKKDLKLIPVKGKEVLYPANEVNVLGSKEKQLTDDEFDFLQEHLIVLDPEWLRFIQALQEKIKQQNQTIDKELAGINNLFSELGLNQGVTIESIFKQAAQAIFSDADPDEKGIHIAHIASRLGITSPDGFKYLCRSGKWQEISFGILLPEEGFLDALYPDRILSAHQISNNDYEKTLSQDALTRWKSWLHSEKSQLRRFLLPQQKNNHIQGKQQVSDFCRQRNGDPPIDYPRKSNTFYVTDYDFTEELWQHWGNSASSEPEIWTYLVFQIAQDWRNGWEAYGYAKIQQEGYSYYHNLDHGRIISSWIERLRKQQCIPDTYSKPRYPSELLRSTSETSALSRIESFVEPDFDQPAFATFLDILGVRNKATDPTRIIDRIRSLSKVSISPPIIQEIVNLYDALDRVILRMSSDQVKSIIDIFTSEKLILSGELTWHISISIYQANPDQIPGVPSIYAASANLNIWERLGISKRPSVDDAIEWLKRLPNGILSDKDKVRVRAIQQRFSEKVWLDSQHWLNLEGKWQSCQEIKWGTEKPHLGNYLFSWVKEATADLSMLESPTVILHLGEILRLEAALEYRLSNYQMSRYKPNPEWISVISRQLLHVKALKEISPGISNHLDLENIREQSQRLSETRFMFVSTLNVTPYIEEQPAGFHSSVKALWHGIFLYVLDDHTSSHREIVDAITSSFKDSPIRTAINDCIGREAAWIGDYFSSYFELGDPTIPDANTDQVESTSYPDVSTTGETIETADDQSDTESGDKSEIRQNDDEGEEDVLEVRKKRKKTLRTEEKFALFIQADQFIWSPSTRFFSDQKGSRIVFTEGIFPWTEYDSSGNEVRCYRIEEGSLEKGLLIRSEVWELMKEMPEFCCLVIHDETKYRKIFWKELGELIHQKLLLISTATYLVKQISADTAKLADR